MLKQTCPNNNDVITVTNIVIGTNDTVRLC